MLLPDFIDIANNPSLFDSSLAHLLISRSASAAEFNSLIELLFQTIDIDNKRSEYLRLYEAAAQTLNRHRQALAKKEQIIENLQEKLAANVTVDALTQLDNEKHFARQVAIALEETKRFKGGGCIFCLEIDNQSQIKELYGEDGIEFVRREVAKDIKSCIRIFDHSCIVEDRSHFLIFYKKMKYLEIRKSAARIKKFLEERSFAYNNKNIRLTVSIGGAACVTHLGSNYKYQELQHQAKIALDNAVKKGRESGGALCLKSLSPTPFCFPAPRILFIWGIWS